MTFEAGMLAPAVNWLRQNVVPCGRLDTSLNLQITTVKGSFVTPVQPAFSDGVFLVNAHQKVLAPAESVTASYRLTWPVAGSKSSRLERPLTWPNTPASSCLLTRSALARLPREKLGISWK
jgi:hypothetical protein